MHVTQIWCSFNKGEYRGYSTGSSKRAACVQYGLECPDLSGARAPAHHEHGVCGFVVCVCVCCGCKCGAIMDAGRKCGRESVFFARFVSAHAGALKNNFFDFFLAW